MQLPDLKPDFPATTPSAIKWLAAQYRDLPQVCDPKGAISFAQMDERSAVLARGLLAAGVGKGTHVGVVFPNGGDYAVALFALLRIGAVAVLMSTMARPREMAHMVRHADLDTLLVIDKYLTNDYIDILEKALPSLAAARGDRPLRLREAPFLRSIWVAGEKPPAWARGKFAALAAGGPNDSSGGIDTAFLAAVEEQIVPADTALIIYTSGSTAEPKAVVHSQGSLIRQGWALSRYMFAEAGDRMLTTMPFFWVGGLCAALMSCSFRGVATVCPYSGRPEDVRETFVRWEPTRISMWKSQLVTLLDRPELAEGFKRVKPYAASQMGSFGVTPQELTPNALGMTETLASHSCFHSAPVPEHLKGTFGMAITDNERKIVHRETGEDLPADQLGVLCLRGGSLTLGMYRKERSEVFDADGWYHTDDLCRMNAEGHLFLEGRVSEMVKINGSNVAPREVEGVILEDPQLREAVVTNVPDPAGKDVLVAAVVPEVGVTVDEAALRARLRAELSPYKVPRYFVFLTYEDIPRTVSAKVRRPELQKVLAQRIHG